MHTQSDRIMQGVVFLGDRTVRVQDFPVPRPGNGQALIQLRRAAVCGSDLHTYRQPRSAFANLPAYIPGHEPSGVVAEVGPQCRRLQVGDRVTVYHWTGCGHCSSCRSGYFQFCPDAQGLGQPATPGSNADYMAVDERNCLLLPDALDFEDGVFIACVAGTCFSALRKLDLNGEKNLAIFGQGPVGLTATLMAKALGVRVIGVDVMPERLALATMSGADAVVNPRTEDLGARIQELTDGQGVEAALETSGTTAAHQGIVNVLRPNGQGVFVGFGAPAPAVNLTDIIRRQLRLTGSFVMPIHYYGDLVRFMLQHDLASQFRRLITHRFSLAQAAEAFQVADTGKAGKVLFVWD